jgi:hypothetical protein
MALLGSSSNADDVRAAKEWALQLVSATGQGWPVAAFLAAE